MKLLNLITAASIMEFSFVAIADSKMELSEGPYGSGQIFVECEFDTIKRNCHLDTGASATFVQADPETSSLVKIGTREFKTAANSVMECDEVRVDSFHALGQRLKNHTVVRCPAPMKSTAGIDLIQNSKRLFDFKSGTISPFFEFPNTSKILDLQIHEKGLFSVEVSINGEKLPGLWDTGAGLTSVSRNFVAKHSDAFEYVQTLSDGGDTSGNSIKADLFRMKRLEIAGQVFENLSVLVFDFEPIKKKMRLDVDLIIGYNALVLRKWYLDLTNSKFVME